MTLNILLIASNFPPRIGGPATSVPELSKKLIERGCNVHVLTVNFPGYESHSIDDGYHVHRAANLNKNPSVAGALSNSFSIISMAVTARKIIAKYNIDVVHAHDLNLSAAAAVLSMCKKPLITKYTGDLSLEYLLLSGNISFAELQKKYNLSSLSDLPFMVKLLDRFQKFLIKKSTVVAAPSEFQRNMLISQGIDENSIVVLRNAVDLNKFHPNIPPTIKKNVDEKILLYAGRLVPWKGVDYLIKAHAKLSDEYKLIIVGDGPSISDLKALVQQLGVKDIVMFTGKISNNEIPKYISSSDIVILPSLYDPFPHSMLETLAMRKPLIATSVGGVPEVIEHKKTGYLVNPGDSNGLADAIKELTNDDALAKRISNNGYEHVIKNYSWDYLINDFIRLYDNIINI